MAFSGVLSRHNRFGFMRSNCSRSRSIPFPITRGAHVKNINVTSSVRKKEASREIRRAAACVRTRWGVSDPRRSGSGTASGGWQRGSLTPHITVVSHRRGFGGGEERRLEDVSKSRFFSDLSRHAAARAVRGVRVDRCLALGGQGEHCSRVCVPPPRHTLSRIVDAELHVRVGTQE
jgi:hypothetical protein